MTPDQILEALHAWLDQNEPIMLHPQEGVDRWYIETVIGFPEMAQFLFDKFQEIQSR